MFSKAISSVVILMLALPVCANQQQVDHTAQPEQAKLVPAVPEQQALIDQWGVEALRVTLSASDYMVDFRYKVIDPEKAAKVVNRKDQPYIRNTKSGKNSLVPAPANVGALRHTGGNLKKGSNYFVLFANPGKTIKRGDKITLVMGEYKLENVIVQ